MEELVNMIASGNSAADISDQIKDLLYAKAAGKVDDTRPAAAASLFGSVESEESPEVATAEEEPNGE